MKGATIPREVKDYMEELRSEVFSLRMFKQAAWSRAVIDLQFWALREGMSLGPRSSAPAAIPYATPNIAEHFSDQYYVSIKVKEGAQNFAWQNPAVPPPQSFPAAGHGMDALYERNMARHRPRRVHLRCPVRFKSLEGEKSKVGWVKNLSTGGIFIQSEQEAPKPGTMIALGFVLDHQDARHLIKTMGQIAWVKNGEERGHRGFGLKFVDPSHELLETIEKVVYECEPETTSP